MRDRRDRAETLVRIERERAPHGLVGGLDLQSEGNQTIEVQSAADGETLGRCPVAHPRDIEKAAEAARLAHAKIWSRDRERRARGLERLARVIRDHQEDLAILESLQTGRSYRDVLHQDLDLGVRTLRAAAGWLRAQSGEHHALGEGRGALVEGAPFPVRGVVLPATEALGVALRTAALALAGGSGVVFLAPPEAPLGVLRLAALAREASLPTGALNALTGDGRGSAEHLAEAPHIDALSFFGPLELARRMLVSAAKSNLKPVDIEIESKMSCILLAGADLSRAVEEIFRSGLASGCQRSPAVGRVIVHESLYAELARRLTQLAKSAVLSHPLDEHTELGPLCSEERMKRVLAYVELGRREGASLVAGGTREVEGSRFSGWYVRPTLFLDPPVDGRLVREPVGGPVVTLEPFSEDEDALERAHHVLGRHTAAVFGEDDTRARRFARQLEFGTVAVNQGWGLEPELPHAGAGEGARPRLGRVGLTGTFTRWRTLLVRD